MRYLFSLLFGLFLTVQASAFALVDLGTASNTSGATLSLTLTSNVPKGTLIVVCLNEHGTTGGTLGTMADGASNTYNVGPNGDDGGVGGADHGQLLYVYNANQLNSGQILTYTKSTSGNRTSFSVAYAPGNWATNPGLGSASNNGNSATPSYSFSAFNFGPGQNYLLTGCIAANGGVQTFTQDSTNGAYATPFTEVKTGTGSGDARVNGGYVVKFMPPGVGGLSGTYAPTYSSSVHWVDMLGVFSMPQSTSFIFSPNVLP